MQLETCGEKNICRDGDKQCQLFERGSLGCLGGVNKGCCGLVVKGNGRGRRLGWFINYFIFGLEEKDFIFILNA